ncbi:MULTISPECIES: hypothetical protein [unclassified Sulfitobacter]|uniref:hypothetical protein n=1 Tax=unclassified Sulfitobacter TaxID=196795 RepID=UPI000AB9E909|nr:MULTISPECIES: hypothetical protein [unclassified Sulfitobacter]MBO9437292.1 hypothetical protein [Sulfitobacter sp. R18_2]
MSQPTDKKVMDLVAKWEATGRIVRKVIIEGKRIEVEFDRAPVKGVTLDNVKW